MNWQRILSLFLVLIPVLVYSQEDSGADSLVKVHAQLRADDDGEFVAFAHIFNPGLKLGTTSDSLGFFSIYMRREDSLYISAIGFHNSYFSLPGFWPSNYYNGVVPVTRETYKIDQVSVHALPGYSQLKREVAESIKPPTPVEKRAFFISEISRKEAVDWNKVSVGFDLSFPSREERSLKKLQIMLKEDLKKQRMALKFNEENIGEMSGLKGEELRIFMNYCNFSDEFLLEAKEYDILHRAKRLLKRYARQSRLR